MPRIYERQWAAFDGSSGQSSTYTSNAYFVGDAGRLSVSWDTDSADASRLTVQISNDQGFTSAISFWTSGAVLTARGVGTVSNNTFSRWARVLRGSEESLAIVNIQFQSAG